MLTKPSRSKFLTPRTENTVFRKRAPPIKGKRLAAQIYCSKGISRRSDPSRQNSGKAADYAERIEREQPDARTTGPELPDPTESDLEQEGLLSKDGGIPEWVRNMQDAANAGDVEYKKVLEGTDNDPIKIIKNINAEMERKRQEMFHPENADQEEGKQMRVRFREIAHWNLWIWVKFKNEPSARDKELLREVFKSWFVLGRLSAFNGMSLQVFHHASGDTSYFDYDHEELDSGLTSCFHEMSELQFNGHWARTWLDLGTADEFSLDVLINGISGLSREHVTLTDLIIGGENDDWPVPSLQFEAGHMSEGVPEGLDLAKFGDRKEPVPGYELDELEEIDDIDRYIKDEKNTGW
uniref:DUF3531 domain-containing protein n=1 Tax=Tetraselmis sp. GSL018 TaxID=582737 RepID=A0A061QMJ2_9CHLO|eukprot:CAMPEP_0177626936 /NCGR_PEP_ID=MMETSP0419_2-20121207/30932_1 /TAXON_ID=582737 /ORGANISM="Tetraselmis sp., Strain GSL018" /LENGTH=351 /DNA_ID=CAMNT_0019128049 /DNA_START=73 /DNA_END=1128 /DNA_ORIENTATION=+